MEIEQDHFEESLSMFVSEAIADGRLQDQDKDSLQDFISSSTCSDDLASSTFSAYLTAFYIFKEVAEQLAHTFNEPVTVVETYGHKFLKLRL